MRIIADSILHGDIQSKSSAIWELQNAKPTEAALLTNILIDIVDDETSVPAYIAAKYHEYNIKLAGDFAAFYTPKTITLGDLAAFSIRRIRQNLIIETSGDGGPTTTLLAVRKAISKRIVPMLYSKNETIRIRILKDILTGDTDPSPIKRLLSCCLNDTSSTVRKYALMPFVTYAHSSKNKMMPVVPKLIDLLNDPDEQVRYIAQRILKIISGSDFGTNTDAWKEWFSKIKQ